MAFCPKISVIIAVKNAKSYLHETLQSLQAQQYPQLEVIVIDGASTDGSQAVLTVFQDIVQKGVSEKDQGISDAFNKGLALATGEYINFQGAGDTLISPTCFKQLFSDLDQSYELVCGKVIRVQEDGKTPLWIAPRTQGMFKAKTLLFKMGLPHQALFTHRRFFEKFGYFDLSTRYAMDYELLLRAYHQFPKTIIKDVLISKWRAGGVGKDRIQEVLDEYHQIKLKHQIAAKPYLIAIDKFNRLKYELKTKYLRMAY